MIENEDIQDTVPLDLHRKPDRACIACGLARIEGSGKRPGPTARTASQNEGKQQPHKEYSPYPIHRILPEVFRGQLSPRSFPLGLSFFKKRLILNDEAAMGAFADLAGLVKGRYLEAEFPALD